MVVLFDRIRGLEASTIRRLIARAAAGDADDLLPGVKAERDRMLDAGVVEVREVRETSRLGGLDVLQAHLLNVRELLRDYRQDRSDRLLELLPKGMLLLGPPGCGKSLTAEVAARTLDVPLLQLHATRLMDRYLGASEQHLESALATARAAAPCVLWVDELEKAVGGLDSSGEGTGRRMLGRLLSWMQDNRYGVYVIATANSLDQVPPELLRRGRFDDHFALDLPTESERKAILDIELGDAATLTSEERLFLAKELKGFSGADIAALVRDARRLARLRDYDDGLGRSHMEEARKGFEPQSKQFPEEMKRLAERLKHHNFRQASSKCGTAEPVRKRQDGPSLPLPLRSLVRSPRPWLVQWDSDAGWVLELATIDTRRVAKLGQGDERGVAAAGEVARFDVQQSAETLRLVRVGGSEDGIPPEMRIAYSNREIEVGWKGVSHSARSRPIRRERSVHPQLWGTLGAEEERLRVTIPEGGDGDLRVWEGTEGRVAELTLDTCGVVARYVLRLEGHELLFEPHWAAGRPWFHRHSLAVVGTDRGLHWTFPPFDGKVVVAESGDSASPRRGTKPVYIRFSAFGLEQLLFPDRGGHRAELEVVRRDVILACGRERSVRKPDRCEITFTKWWRLRGSPSIIAPDEVKIIVPDAAGLKPGQQVKAR